MALIRPCQPQRLKVTLPRKDVFVMLTANDFHIVGIICPVCQRPARVYSRKGHNYLRCTFEDCRLNKNMVVPDMESFYRRIEKIEEGDAK